LPQIAVIEHRNWWAYALAAVVGAAVAAGLIYIF
jgi:hypothetical protein